jgi:acyl-homoserine-lactone acylase
MTRERSLPVLVTVLALGPQVQARWILVFGENSDSKSKHDFDRSELYAKQQFKPAYCNLTEIKAHSERIYYPGKGKP